jgi:hypothetical protein
LIIADHLADLAAEMVVVRQRLLPAEEHRGIAWIRSVHDEAVLKASEQTGISFDDEAHRSLPVEGGRL